jgi:hypothetical protein
MSRESNLFNPPPPDPPVWCQGTLDPSSAAARLNDVTEDQIHRWVAAGRVRSQRRGKRLLVRLDDVHRLAAESRDLPAPAPPLLRRVEDHRRKRQEAPS